MVGGRRGQGERQSGVCHRRVCNRMTSVALVLADQVSRADRDTDPGQPTILGPLARRVSSFNPLESLDLSCVNKAGRESILDSRKPDI